MPKSTKRKGKVVWKFLTTNDTWSRASSKETGKEAQDQAERLYRRKYGTKNVEAQKHFTSTGKIPDIVVHEGKRKAR